MSIRSDSDQLPSHEQVQYAAPHIPLLLSLAAYLYLLACTSSISGWLTNAPLLGPLLTGIFLGPELGGLLTPAIQTTFIDIGYIGLILIVFEAGLTTNISLLFSNAALSCIAALTGILVPIAFSMALFHGAWRYSALQAFAAGAALCSTSLGTTLALLAPELRKTRVGSVLMAAALLDDVVGLVIAGIVPQLASTSEGGLGWETIVRPILVSFAFGIGTPLLAWAIQKAAQRTSHLNLPQLPFKRSGQPKKTNVGTFWRHSRIQLFLIVAVLFGYVAAAKYAGTSELFGAYLAGTLLAYIFDDTSPALSSKQSPSSPLLAFEAYLQPILTPLLGPIFFASIGAALPIGSLFTTHSSNGKETSHRVVWRGIVYSIMMIVGKMTVGLCMAAWPDRRREQALTEAKLEHIGPDPEAQEVNEAVPESLRVKKKGDGAGHTEGIGADNAMSLGNSSCVEPTTIKGSASPLVQFDHTQVTLSAPELSRKRSAILLGLAMVARGEIALIVAQLGKPLLVGSVSENADTSADEEPFAIVVWAVLLSTLIGALGVGLAIGFWEKRDRKSREEERNLG
ncbi:Sodium/hydrogen exchanger [Agrocybe pediades]|nr:Sodium/hydrogen exchanger [Agrocybe pediades]